MFRFFKSKNRPSKVAPVPLPDTMTLHELYRVAVHGFASLLMDRHHTCKRHWWCAKPPGAVRPLVLVPKLEHSQHTGEVYVSVFINSADLPQGVVETLPQGTMPPISLLSFDGDAPLSKLQISATSSPNVWSVVYGTIHRDTVTHGNRTLGAIDPDNCFTQLVHESPPWAKTFQPDFSDDGLDSLLVRTKPPDGAYPRLHLIERSDGWNIYLVDESRLDDKILPDTFVIRDFLVASVPMDSNPKH